MKYEGQEKILMKEGQFKGVYGYVRRAHDDGRLLIILDNGYKISSTIEEVEYIHSNYFLVGIEEYKKTLKI